MFTAEDVPNTIIVINMISIWLWRQHNLIAQNLARVNPCWNDELLFDTAKDINIAIAQQIIFYELLPAWMGKFYLTTSFEQLRSLDTDIFYSNK